ncbi:MAG: tyrosine-type recombinase/integrase [Nanoarchaeota archaeon]|nr:tyrosine-type recombinase/integrase [Nanoarchaeota archaeon]MBU1622252.1 tyrosine-type recombinase/integrase [Nanoarchaeota archaeon]MBU1974735.1 tyrosine-type recombinase/integrase [Nanoarchaeota archaeon]
MGIHNYERKYIMAKKNLEKSSISKRNKELILKFVDDLILENLSKPRLIKYFTCLKIIAQALGKDLDKATIADLKKFVSYVQQRNDYSAWTKHSYKVIVRRFYKWFKKTKGKKYPPIVDWIKIGMSRSEKNLPTDGDLINEKDVEKIINAAHHPRDKAFVSVLWESGARIGEIGNLKMRNVVFDKFGIVIAVKGKTGSRKIRLISSTPYFSTWINNHPFKDNQQAALWINRGTTNFQQPMKYRNMRKILINLFAQAGIKKKCNPHLFRHSRATFMAHHLTEFQMNQYFGWIQGSDMPATYVHMSGKEVDKAILKMNGFAHGEEKEESKLLPKRCPRCETINAHDSKHCNKCGGILDLKFAMEQEEERKSSNDIMATLLRDKEIQAILMEKLKQIGLPG